MTLAIRNSVIRSGAVIAVFILVVFALVVYQLTRAQPDTFVAVQQLSWLTMDFEVTSTDTYAGVAGAGAAALVSTIALLAIARVVRRVNSSEMYFFAMFLFTVALEPMRAMQLYVIQFDAPVVYGALLTRLVVAARLSGCVFLFVGSLYAVGMEYPRIGSITLAVAIGALVFVTVVPVDTQALNATLLHRLNGQASVELVMLALSVFTIANYALAGARGHRERGFLVAFAIVCVVVSAQIAWFIPLLSWAIASVVLLVFGTLTFVLITRAHFLWY